MEYKAEKKNNQQQAAMIWGYNFCKITEVFHSSDTKAKLFIH